MIFIGCAAVADYRVAKTAEQKIKKHVNADCSIDLVLNPDIVSEVVKSKQCAYVVGFAAETNDLLRHAKEKLRAKKLDMLVANQVGDGLGFEKEENKVIILTADEKIDLPKAHKTRLAGQVIAIMANKLHNSKN